MSKDPVMKIKLEKGDDKLREIIHKASKGEEILVSDSDGGNFRVAVTHVQNEAKKKRVFGFAKGLIEMKDNFDDPIPGLEAYMPRATFWTRPPLCGLRTATAD